MKEDDNVVIDGIDINANSSSNFYTGIDAHTISNPYMVPSTASWVDHSHASISPTPEGEIGYALVKEGGKLKAYPMQKIEDAVVNSDWSLPVFDKSLIKWVLRNAKYVRITAKEVKWLEQFYDIIPPDPKVQWEVEKFAEKPRTYGDTVNTGQWRITPHAYYYNANSGMTDSVKTSNVYTTK